MPDITLNLGQAPAGNALTHLNANVQREYADLQGPRAHRLPLHAGVNELGFLRRVDSWKQNGSFDAVSYHFLGSSAPENLHLAFYRLAPRKPEQDQYGGYKSAYLKALEARWNEGAQASWQKVAGLVAERQRQLEAALDASGWKTLPLDLVTDARLIAGLGYEGPLEVGLSIHPLYGIPYLPGSSVKGIARAYAEVVLKRQGTVTKALINEVFGSPDKNERRAEDFRLGCVRFFDAFPTQFPKLAVDVLTPHFIDYYMEKSLTPNWKEAPGDWHEPKPTAFLAVKENQPFRFLLAARAGDGFTEAAAQAHLDRAATWLTEGLKTLGAGGKTAAGYGYFATPDERRAAAAELRRLQEEMLARDKEAEEQALAAAAAAKVEREARERAEREERARREEEERIEEERARLEALEPVPEGSHAGVVRSLRPAKARGNIDPVDGGEPVPFRFADAPDMRGIVEGAFVLFELVMEGNQRRATKVRVRRDTRRAG